MNTNAKILLVSIGFYAAVIIGILVVLPGCQSREDAYWGSVSQQTGKVVNHGR